MKTHVGLTLALSLGLVSCAYSAASVNLRPAGSSVDEARAVQIAEQTAVRFRLGYRGAGEGELPMGGRLLAEFSQKTYPRDEYYRVDGSVANIRFFVFREPDEALSFAFIDYSHGAETDYVRLMREDLESRLRDAFPDAQMEYEQHSGRTIAR